MNPETTANAISLIRLVVGGMFVVEGILKFLYPHELAAGRFAEIGIADPQSRSHSKPASSDRWRHLRVGTRKRGQKVDRHFWEFTQVAWAQRDLNPRPSDYE